MLGDQFKFLVMFYVNPKKAASAVLDHGKFLFALIAAVLVTLFVSAGADTARIQEQRQLMTQSMSTSGPPEERSVQAFEAYQRVERQLEGRFFATSLKSVVVMATVFVPVCILVLTAWAHLGGRLTILFRDFMPVLAGLLFAWTVAHIPIGLVWWTGQVPPAGVVPLQLGGLAYFLVLAAAVLSTVMGVSLSQAATATIPGLAAAGAASLLFANSGNILYMFASPWLLYYGYQMFGRDVSALGGGLAARQNFKRQLEIATVNPRDADAHYQLGLIYVQRRAFADAEASFRRALEIDPNEPDALFQLGRLLRQQGNNSEAQQLLERGAQIDPKLASHQVWRELGALALAVGTTDTAIRNLEYYVNIREYDPEGLVLYGRALKAAQKPQEAKAAFEKAIEAVKTAPKFRKSELSPWEKQARQELKG